MCFISGSTQSKSEPGLCQNRSYGPKCLNKSLLYVSDFNCSWAKETEKCFDRHDLKIYLFKIPRAFMNVSHLKIYVSLSELKDPFLKSIPLCTKTAFEEPIVKWPCVYDILREDGCFWPFMPGISLATKVNLQSSTKFSDFYCQSCLWRSRLVLLKVGYVSWEYVTMQIPT